MNKIILMGHLSTEPELHHSQNEKKTAVTRFDIAIDRRGKSQEEQIADFFHCTAFAKQAEFVSEYFGKGSRMLLTGHMENNNYTNKDGNMVYGYQVIVEEVEFADSKKKNDADGGSTEG